MYSGGYKKPITVTAVFINFNLCIDLYYITLYVFNIIICYLKLKQQKQKTKNKKEFPYFVDVHHKK